MIYDMNIIELTLFIVNIMTSQFLLMNYFDYNTCYPLLSRYLMGGVSRPSMSACLIESKKDRTYADIDGHRRT